MEPSFSRASVLASDFKTEWSLPGLDGRKLSSRYDLDGKVFAYSYGLIPVHAHKNGKSKMDDEAACIFFATFVAVKGDGIFRELVRGGFAPDLVPLGLWIEISHEESSLIPCLRHHL